MLETDGRGKVRVPIAEARHVPAVLLAGMGRPRSRVYPPSIILALVRRFRGCACISELHRARITRRFSHRRERIAAVSFDHPFPFPFFFREGKYARVHGCTMHPL